MAAKKAKPGNDIGDLLERVLGTESVLSVNLDDVGVVVGDRKFSFSGKLTVGPISVGRQTKR